MQNLKLSTGLILGTVAYRFLMKHEDLGLNALIFAVLLVAALFAYKTELRSNKQMWAIAGAFIASAAGVVITGIVFSTVIYYLMLIVFLAFVQSPGARSMWCALLLLPYNSAIAVWMNINLLGNSLGEIFRRKTKHTKQSSLKYWQILAIIALALLFIWTFSVASPQFSRLVSTVWNNVWDFLKQIIPDISLIGVVRFLFVMYFLSLFFLRFKDNMMLRDDMQTDDNLRRSRQRQFNRFLPVGLKSEYVAAFTGIAVFSILLLTLNILDIISVWIGITPDSAAELSMFVHRGTYALIISVMLSCGILLFYFRRNLNFYPNSCRFKILAYSWIAQNLFLLCSTGMRNWSYVDGYGLTYKRIGVFIFLIMVCLSLFLLFIKIHRQKTHYHFIRMSIFGSLALLVLCSLVNWDTVIASHNTSGDAAKQADYWYLKQRLSYQAAPYILDDALAYGEHEYCSYIDECETYVREVEARSWKSFNLGDMLAARKLKIKLENINTNN